MPDLKLVIKNCLHCPWKTEYNGWPKDYWMCDQVPGWIIPSKYLKEETVGEPWFCPWRDKFRRNIGTHPPPKEDGSLPDPPTEQERSMKKLMTGSELKAKIAILTIGQRFQLYKLAIKYWCQGDDWEKAGGYALSLIVGWKR